MREKEALTHLGSRGTEYKTEYDPSLLETRAESILWDPDATKEIKWFKK